ncbi:OmpA family protein [Rhodovibrio salinarum]|nr:OmpA family protein [Rhodovibrio salinarum]
MAQSLIRAAAIGVCALALASCAGTELEDTRNLNVQGGAFNSALYEGYVDRSQFEYDYGDYNSSDLYAQRAQRVAAGQTVQPLTLDGDGNEAVEGVDKMDTKLPAIRQARADLLDALNNGARQDTPEAAAEAQVAFDCWVEETQPDQIAKCRQRFEQAFQTVQNAAEPAEMDQASETAPAAPEEVDSTEPESFTVYFAFDSAQLSEEAREVIGQVAEAAEDRPNAEISATGYTDTVGPEDYNQDLSFRRAQAVQEALTGRDIAEDRIGTAARGENQLAVETADGVAEPRNRRVEISLF